jgi:hypothetical protein
MSSLIGFAADGTGTGTAAVGCDAPESAAVATRAAVSRIDAVNDHMRAVRMRAGEAGRVTDIT